MKYLLTALLGFLLGAAAAVAALYYDPFTQGGGPVPADGDTLLTYASPVSSALAFTHGRLSRLPANPPGVADLWEATINKSALAIVVLRGDDGTSAAIGSRLSYPSEDTDFLLNGVLLNDDWLVSVPGRGSLFITAQSNWWPLLKDAVIPVWYLGRPWRGPAVYEPTVGPGVGNQAIVRGASGEFAGRQGSAAERYQMEDFDARVGPRQVYAQLYWRFVDPAPETAAD